MHKAISFNMEANYAFFLFIFLAVIHTANGTAKTLLEVNGTKISERVFRDYAEYLYKDEYFLVHNTKLKKQMVIDNIINNVLTSQKNLWNSKR